MRARPVRHLGRLDDAETSLKRISTRELGDLARLFVHYTRALIALERGQCKEAHDHLVDVAGMIPLSVVAAAKPALLADVYAFRALALAGLGKQDEARDLFATARPRLEAQRDRPLIERCLKAIPSA